MAQSVECPALDFGSGHDLRVVGLEPQVGFHAESPGNCLRYSLSLPLALSHSKIKIKKKKNRESESDLPKQMGQGCLSLGLGVEKGDREESIR